MQRMQAGRSAVPYDVSYSDRQNVLSSVGFVAALVACIRIRPGGGSLSAPVCSTWVYLARSSTGRSAGWPAGFDNSTCRNANVMVARACLMIAICCAKQVWWLLEQPSGSLLELHPRFQELAAMLQIFRKFIQMGRFGAGSKKGTWLYSGASFCYRLVR